MRINAYFLLMLLAAGLNAGAASIDCDRASAEMEKLVCSDRKLMMLDERMAEAYARWHRSAPAIASELEADQRRWLRLRNACQTTECAGTVYRARIDVLYARVLTVAVNARAGESGLDFSPVWVRQGGRKTGHDVPSSPVAEAITRILSGGWHTPDAYAELADGEYLVSVVDMGEVGIYHVIAKDGYAEKVLSGNVAGIVPYVGPNGTRWLLVRTQGQVGQGVMDQSYKTLSIQRDRSGAFRFAELDLAAIEEDMESGGCHRAKLLGLEKSGVLEYAKVLSSNGKDYDQIIVALSERDCRTGSDTPKKLTFQYHDGRFAP